MQRGSYIVFVAVSLGLIVLSRVDGTVVERVSTTVLDIVGPVLFAFSQPVETVKDGIAYTDQVFRVFEENERLREENARLLKWQALAYQLEQENAAFRSTLKFNPDPRVAYVTARVIGEAGGPFVKTKLVNAGQRLGVTAGMAVLTGEGLVGRIVQAGDRVSRALLLTDLNSRVPVAVVGSRHRAILVGDNENAPKLDFHASNTERIKVGDRVVTSGDGGLFPPGLVVGDVISGAEGHLRVRLAADFDRLDVLRVARYHMPSLEDAHAVSTLRITPSSESKAAAE